MKSVIVSCSATTVASVIHRSLASSETVSQCTGHAGFLTLIFHKVV